MAEKERGKGKGARDASSLSRLFLVQFKEADASMRAPW